MEESLGESNDEVDYAERQHRVVKKSRANLKRHFDEEEKETQFPKPKHVKAKTYLDKCKEVGRVGPEVTKLHLVQGQSTFKVFDEACLDIECLD